MRDNIVNRQCSGEDVSKEMKEYTKKYNEIAERVGVLFSSKN
jgi:hypothetical protein